MTNSLSQTFCSTRWRHATVNLETLVSRSCCFLPFKKLNSSHGLDQFHDNEYETEMRQKMLDGHKVSDCSYCWKLEEAGGLSPRINWAKDEWVVDDYENMSLTNQALTPTWLEVIFSTKCNLRCTYCGPELSSSWRSELNLESNFKKSLESTCDEELKESFWLWFEKIYPQLKRLKITGGEPLLSDELDRLLEFVKSNKNQNLEFGINTNMNVNEKPWKKFVDSLKQVESESELKNLIVFPSIESLGEKAEYARFPLSFKNFTSNLHYLLENTEKVSVHFGATFNIFSITGGLDFWKFVKNIKDDYANNDREIFIAFLSLSKPEHLSVSLLPKSYKVYLDEAIEFVSSNVSNDPKGFLDLDLKMLKEARNLIGAHNTNRDLKIKFYEFIRSCDQRRSTDFLKVFPEMREFYKECEKLFAVSRI